MKRLLTTIILFLSVSFAFADEFSLFPWTCGQKEVFNYCINKGWEYSSDISDNITTLVFKTPETVTYHGYKTFNLRFAFDKNDNLIIQSITFFNLDAMAISLATVLDNMVADKARLTDKEMERDELYHLTFVVFMRQR
jgi:hypothetical protein